MLKNTHIISKTGSFFKKRCQARSVNKLHSHFNATHLDNSMMVRQEMDKQYDNIITMAFVTSVASPTTESSIFIKEMNGLINEINTLYHQRIASANKERKGKGHYE